MTEMPLVCPTCHGEKIIVGMFPVYAEHVPQSHRKPFVEMKCPKCKGKGTITHEQHRQIAAGKNLREKRRTTGLALRECAIALGLPDICDLPYAEQGDLSLERIAEVERLLDVFIVGRDALMADA